MVMNNANQKGLFRCLSVLDKLGYYPISANNDRLLYASIKESLEQMGKSYSGALIRNMCSLYGLSENELFSNYDLFKKMLYTILGEGEANGIITSIKKELLARAILNGSSLTLREMTNPSLSIEDILESIESAQTLRIIAKTSPHEHVLFLYDTEDTKDKLLSTFFSSDRIARTMCLLSLKPCGRLPAIKNITYEKLYEEYRLTKRLNKPLEDDLAKKWSYWRTKLCLSNNPLIEKPAKVADEDLTYWIDRDLTSELVELEQDRHADQRLQHHPDQGVAQRHLARGQRPAARSLDLGIDLAVDDVVPGAARTTHGERTQREQGHPADQPAPVRCCAQRCRPPAGIHQEPDADRPVPARQPGIGSRPRWQVTQRPVLQVDIGEAGCPLGGHGGIMQR